MSLENTDFTPKNSDSYNAVFINKVDPATGKTERFLKCSTHGCNNPVAKKYGGKDGLCPDCHINNAKIAFSTELIMGVC